MKDTNINSNNIQINNDNNSINDTSTNPSSSYELETLGIENPLLITDEIKTNSSFDLSLNNNKEYYPSKITYPPNIFSSLCFSWVFDVIRKSKKNKNLKFSYLGEVSPYCKSEYIFNEIAQKWYGRYKYLLEKLKEMNKRSIYPLFMTLMKANYCRIIFSLILYVAMSILDFIGVFIFKELLNNFKQDKNIIHLDINEMDNKDDETGINFLKNLSLN